MILNNKVSQRLEIIGFKGSVKKLTSRIQDIFITAFEGRLESVFLHPVLKRKVSYRTAMKLDCYKLIKFILEDKEFVPFSLKEMK